MAKHLLKKEKKAKPKRKTSTVMLVLICTMIILYAAASFVLQYFTSVEISPTLTTAWFAFWGTELVALAAIRTSKIKHGVQDSSTQSETTEDEEQ